MKKFKTIYIAAINRSGGSLLARLLDNHSKVLSYPIEIGFPTFDNFYEVHEMHQGVPQTIPNYSKSMNIDVFNLLEIPKEEHQYSTTWGKETSDPLGVRKNYIEKVFYGNIKTDFDYAKFKKIFEEESNNASNIAELYDARHNAYFKSWDNGKYFKEQSHVLMHDSGGLYLTNIGKFYDEFSDSKLIYPIRNVIGYVAAEKTRFARRYYGSRRFAWPQLPNFFVKRFVHYDLEAQIRCWLSALTRVRILQEKYEKNKLIVYRHENLIHRPKDVMKSISSLLDLKYENTLIEPTIAGTPWLGNSHYGPVKGISKSISKNYSKVLRDDEIEIISETTKKLTKSLYTEDNITDLLSINENLFYRYSEQKKYFNDEEKLTLYYTTVNSPKRRVLVKQPDIYSIFAFFYSIFVRILHIPRMIKLKFFKGKGKQNYT